MRDLSHLALASAADARALGSIPVGLEFIDERWKVAEGLDTPERVEVWATDNGGETMPPHPPRELSIQILSGTGDVRVKHDH